ncbi:MAG: hypothetical protein H8E68_01600 [Kiritimatiellaeota bacterium]|nr:hypothetical protein [Kiritimatiellota bacterium]
MKTISCNKAKHTQYIPFTFFAHRVFLLLLMSVFIMGCSSVLANGDSFGNKKIDKQLGAWICDNDKFMIVFFDDNSFLDMNSHESVCGKWERYKKDESIVFLYYPGVDLDSPRYVTVTDNKFIWHHDDGSDSNFCRVLQGGRGTNLKITVVDLDKKTEEGLNRAHR